MNEITVRKAELKDIDSISRIKLSGWQNAYEGIVDKQYLDSLTISNIRENIFGYDINSFFVAEYKDEIVGFCRICDYELKAHEDKSDCELREIYVLPSLKRMCIGTLLFNSVMDYFRSKGKRKMCLGCLKENAPAGAFYKKLGGNIEGESEMNIGHKSYPIIRYTFNIENNF